MEKRTDVKPEKIRTGIEGQRVLWAIDPDSFQSFSELARMKRFLTLWNFGQTEMIRPVSIVPPFEVFGPLDITASVRVDLRRAADENLRAVLGRLQLDDSREPLVLDARESSKAAAVRQIIDIAESDQADFIAVTTHGPSGGKFWHLSGFSERLIATSPVPVLTINPKTVVPEGVGKILFATDFSISSRRLFKRVLRWSAAHGASLVLFHKFENPYNPAAFSDYSILIDERVVTEIAEAAEAACRARLERWRRFSERNLISCQVVNWHKAGSVEDGIFESATEHGADVIVTGTHRGPVGQRFLGSVARNVLVAAQRPVIVVHE